MKKLKYFLTIVSLFFTISNALKCYDDNSQTPVYCHPQFHDAAKGRRAFASNTCGIHNEQEFCHDLYSQAKQSACEKCNSNNPLQEHGAQFITDGLSNTFWASETLGVNKKIHYETSINVTIDLGGQHEVQHVGMLFHSQRPRAMVLHRKISENANWTPWAYFSQDCLFNFKMPSMTGRNEDLKAVDDLVCYQYHRTTINRDLFVYFAPIEKRPGEEDYISNQRVRNWALASQILIEIKKLATHGDEYEGSKASLRIYFASLTSVTVNGRMFCNGHGAEVDEVLSGGIQRERRCRCDPRHFTTGKQCEKCLDDYDDAPWEAATLHNANPCKPCQCNGNSRTCEFDRDLFEMSGGVSGGRCTNCQNNSMGPHCEQCKPKHYRDPNNPNVCLACQCNELGSEDNGRCDVNGKCLCKPGVGGNKCDRCERGYYAFNKKGCLSCQCDPSGTIDNKGECDQFSGRCSCKANVVGDRCNMCKPGHFGLKKSDPRGCQACFCFGFSTNCSAAENGYVSSDYLFAFDELYEPLIIYTNDQNKLNPVLKKVRRLSDASLQSFATFPANADSRPYSAHLRLSGFNKNGRFFRSYNLFLQLELSFTQLEFVGQATNRTVIATTDDIRLNSNLYTVSIAFDAMNNPMPRLSTNEEEIVTQIFTYRLNEYLPWKWVRKSGSTIGLGNTGDFQRLIAEVTDVEIRMLHEFDVTRVHRVSIQSIEPLLGESGPLSFNVEKCICPPGLIGDSCEKCDFFHRRESLNPNNQNNRYLRCVRCQCNGHATTCDETTGNCHCTNGTSGSECTQCADGFYGNALDVDIGCKPCQCPGGGKCASQTLLDKNSGQFIPTIVCLECPNNRTGSRCERCQNGFFGKPKYGGACRPCECSGNENKNSAEICDHETGKCKACDRFTEGDHCEKCQSGFYGDPLLDKFVACKPCGCELAYTTTDRNGKPICNATTGICLCKNGFIGDTCDQCPPGMYIKDEKCTPCSCEMKGSKSMNCSLRSGQCTCKEGVQGRRCDKCKDHFYGLGTTAVKVNAEDDSLLNYGCLPCKCHEHGTISFISSGRKIPVACNANNGSCSCKENVIGEKCDKCKLNYYNINPMCEECPACYGRLSKRVTEINETFEERLKRGDFNRALSNDSSLIINQTIEKIQNLHLIVMNLTRDPLLENISTLSQLMNEYTTTEKRWNYSANKLPDFKIIQMQCPLNASEAKLEKIVKDLANFTQLAQLNALNVDDTLRSFQNDELIETFGKSQMELTAAEKNYLQAYQNALKSDLLLGDVLHKPNDWSFVYLQMNQTEKEAKELKKKIVPLLSLSINSSQYAMALGDQIKTINSNLMETDKKVQKLTEYYYYLLLNISVLGHNLDQYNNSEKNNFTNYKYDLLNSLLANVSQLVKEHNETSIYVRKLWAEIMAKRKIFDDRLMNIEKQIKHHKDENVTRILVEYKRKYDDIVKTNLRSVEKDIYGLTDLIDIFNQSLSRNKLPPLMKKLEERKELLNRYKEEFDKLKEETNATLELSKDVLENVTNLQKSQLLVQDIENKLIDKFDFNNDAKWKDLFEQSDELLKKLRLVTQTKPLKNATDAHNQIKNSLQDMKKEINSFNETIAPFQDSFKELNGTYTEIQSIMKNFSEEKSMLDNVRKFVEERYRKMLQDDPREAFRLWFHGNPK